MEIKYLKNIWKLRSYSSYCEDVLIFTSLSFVCCVTNGQIPIEEYRIKIRIFLGKEKITHIRIQKNRGIHMKKTIALILIGLAFSGSAFAFKNTGPKCCNVEWVECCCDGKK